MFMTKKSQALDCFKEYQALVEGPTGEQIGILHTHRGGEYVGKEFKRYLMSQQIDHEETDAESPEQNGVAERLNRTLMDKARVMVAHTGLSKRFWAEVVNTANYHHNRSPCQSFRGHITPYESWHGKKPDIAHLGTFGCIAYARIPDRKRTKLDDKVERVRFLGYSKGGKGYRLLEEVGNRMKHWRDVTFDETQFVFTVPVPSKETVDHVSDQCDRMEADKAVGARPEEPVPEGARPKAVNPVGAREAAPPEAPTKVVERPQRHCPKIKRWGIDEVYLSEMNFVHSAFSARTHHYERSSHLTGK